MEKVYLSRRNLLSLISKLDRKMNGEFTHCTLIKHDICHPKYPQSMESISVIAIEDDEYYVDRDPGEVFYLDEPPRT